ncbi:transcription factor ILI3-like [Hibiscus syriacus]|uniref:transcription factor ILI3-like n=1 Tax=Hibiscus syriacus TaxID=106335 RepID=UPI0019238C4D|nr:transcription factor ILI3-like [Hibiscus syriacus]
MSSKRNEDFCLQLQELLSTDINKKRNANKLLEEICSHIKKLNGEVDALSIRISELMASLNKNSGTNVNILRQLLQQ